jgi:hypothetical protein
VGRDCRAALPFVFKKRGTLKSRLVRLG